VADGQAFGHRILAAQDMHVGAADRRGGDTHQCVQRANLRDRLVIQHDAILFDEYHRFHHGHGQDSCAGVCSEFSTFPRLRRTDRHKVDHHQSMLDCARRCRP